MCPVRIVFAWFKNENTKKTLGTGLKPRSAQLFYEYTESAYHYFIKSICGIDAQ